MGCTPSKHKAHDHANKDKESSLVSLPRHASRDNLVHEHTSNYSVFLDYKVIRNLGTGSLGSVDLVVLKDQRKRSPNESDDHDQQKEKLTQTAGCRSKKNHERHYALKSIITTELSTIARNELKNEIEILRSLDHPNIVRLYSTYESTDNVYLVMQCCEGGDLWSMVPYTEAEAARILSSICSAVSYMHSNNITHRDLKFENIMFEKRGQGATVKIIDFGFGKRYAQDARFLFDICGTLYTMSPQQLRGTYTSATDNWAIGVVAFIMLSNRKPFYHKVKEVTIRKIMTCDYNFYGKGWENVSSDAKDFVSKLLVSDPFQRITATQACTHKWLANAEKMPKDSNSNIKSEQPSSMPLEEYMDILKENMQAYAGACEFKKLALTIVAHKSNSDELLQLHEAFQQFDTGNDGVIRKSEFVSMMKRFNYDDDEIESMFTSMDSVFENGYIPYVTFIAASLEACGKLEENRLREAFARLDTDNSGFITKDNLRHVLGSNYYTEEKAMEIIRQVDSTNSGVISYRDFINQFKTQNTKLLDYYVGKSNSQHINKISQEDVMQYAKSEFDRVPHLRKTLSVNKNEPLYQNRDRRDGRRVQSSIACITSTT